MNKNLDYIAFDEAGHAIAHILAGIPFKYVTIKEEKKRMNLDIYHLVRSCLMSLRMAVTGINFLS